MFERKSNLQKSLITLAVSFTALSLTSCGSGSTGNGVTAQKTIGLDKLKVGLPEPVFKEASITFYLDPTPGADAGGKSQYISKMFNAQGGQYVAECRDDKCFELQITYEPNTNKSVDKATALKDLKTLLPDDAGEPTKTSTKDLKAGKNTNEYYYYGDKYCGVLTYTNKAQTAVKSVSAFEGDPEDVENALGGRPVKAKKAAPAADSKGDGASEGSSSK